MGTNFRRQILTSKVCPRAEGLILVKHRWFASMNLRLLFSGYDYDYNNFTIITMAAFISIVINHRKNTLIFTHKNHFKSTSYYVYLICGVVGRSRCAIMSLHVYVGDSRKVQHVQTTDEVFYYKSI